VVRVERADVEEMVPRDLVEVLLVWIREQDLATAALEGLEDQVGRGVRAAPAVMVAPLF
jgi:hypothetical protein